MSGVVYPAGEGERHAMGASEVVIKATGEDTGRALLPGPPEAAEAFNHFLLGHTVAVVEDANFIDTVELVAAELDLDLLGVRIEPVPDQFRDAG